MKDLLLRHWFSLDRKIRFLFVGAWNSAVSYLLFALLFFLFNNSHQQIALLLSFIISSLQSYIMQKYFVFQTVGNVKKEYTRCLLVWGLGYLLNVFLLEFLTGWVFVGLGVFNTYISQFVAMFIVAVASYILLKLFAFKRSINA